MKKNGVTVVVLLAFFLTVAFPFPAMAEEKVEKTEGAETGVEQSDETKQDYLERFIGELDFAELDELMDTELFPGWQEKICFSDVVETLVLQGTEKFDYSMIADWVRDMLFYEVDVNRKLLVEVVLLAVGFSMLKNFSGTLNEAYISDICFLLVYGILAVLLMQSFTGYESIASEALGNSVDFMKALVPTFCISMVFSAASALSPARSSVRL